jgi:hypothetical protein
MIVDRKWIFKPDGTIILRNTVDPSALLEKIYQYKQEKAKEGAMAAKGFNPERTTRFVGAVTPSIMIAHPLLREGWQAEMAGDQDYADRCFKLFFNTNPQYRTSLGQI